MFSDSIRAVSYYTLSDGIQTILPAEAMEAQNPYPFGIDPVKSHICVQYCLFAFCRFGN